MTKEQVDRAAEFVPADWKDLEQTTWEDELDALLGGDDDASAHERSGFSAESLATAAEERLKGTIVGVQRKQRTSADEQTAVSIRTDSGATHEVLLGPSWYVMGHAGAPMRGDSIDTTMRVIREDGAEVRVATSVTIDGTPIPLRDKDLRPHWRTARSDHRDSSGASQAHHSGSGRLMLLSDLIGAKAMALDEDGGSVHSAVIERRSGRIALIGFDPNENFLGIGDTLRCVPWPVVSIRDDDVVVIDASSHMLQTCEALPDDVTVFAAPVRLEPVYRVFQIEVEQFEPNAATKHRTGEK
jgi:hypothetical protein